MQKFYKGDVIKCFNKPFIVVKAHNSCLICESEFNQGFYIVYPDDAKLFKRKPLTKIKALISSFLARRV